MCAIAGSSNFSEAYELYSSGLERGHFGSGLLTITDKIGFVYKQRMPFTRDDVLEWVEKIEDVKYWAFHSRAPTNVTQKEWCYETTHPFNFGSYYVAHNGIINNFSLFPESAEFEIDSSIIPYHLSVNNGDIQKTYQEYTGLLTSWIYDISTHDFYLVKAGSSLFRTKTSFSSVEFLGSERVSKDGVIYKLNDCGYLQEIDGFKYDNPYFIL
jgi:hypothetical protein